MAIIKIVIQRRTQTFMVLRKELLREFIKENDLTTTKEIQNALKEVFTITLQEMLEAELDDHLGYSKYEYKNKETKNSRNGNSSKRVISDLGELEIAMPRDRYGDLNRRLLKSIKLMYQA